MARGHARAQGLLSIRADMTFATNTPAPLRHAQDLLASAQAQGRPQPMVTALTELARAWADEAAFGTAEAHLEQALRWSTLLPAVDTQVDLLCQAAEMAAVSAERATRENDKPGCRAARRRALAHAFEAARLSEQVACPGWEVVVLLRISDVLDRCGRRDDAAALQTRAVRMMFLEGSAFPA